MRIVTSKNPFIGLGIYYIKKAPHFCSALVLIITARNLLNVLAHKILIQSPLREQGLLMC